MYDVRMWRVRVTIVAMETQQYFHFFIVVGVDVAVKNTRVCNFAKGMQKLIPLALLSNNKTLRTAVDVLIILTVSLHSGLSFPDIFVCGLSRSTIFFHIIS